MSISLKAFLPFAALSSANRAWYHYILPPEAHWRAIRNAATLIFVQHAASTSSSLKEAGSYHPWMYIGHFGTFPGKQDSEALQIIPGLVSTI
jgi:hypothetical protein